MSNTDGSQWSLVDRDLTTRLNFLPTSVSHLYFVINEPGSASLDIPMDSLAAEQVEHGMFARNSYRNAIRGGFFIDTIKQNFVDTGNVDGGLWMNLAGRGEMAVLEDAIVWADGTGNTRSFSGTLAATLIQLIEEAQNRSGILQVETDFTATTSTDSASWGVAEPIDLKAGTTLLEVVRKFAKKGMEFSMRYVAATGKFVLSAYKNGIGSDVSSTIKFRVGSNCKIVKSNQSSGKDLHNAYLLAYKGGNAVVQDGTSISTNRRKEKFLDVRDAQSVESVVTYGSAILQDSKDPKFSIEVEVYDGVGPRLFVDYGIGSTISLDINGSTASYRVLGINCDFNGNKYSDVRLELNDLILEHQYQVAQELEDLTERWRDANESDLLEVRYWANIGKEGVEYPVLFESEVIGTKLYVGGQQFLAAYDTENGMWEDISTTIYIQGMKALGTKLYIAGVDPDVVHLTGVCNDYAYVYDTEAGGEVELLGGGLGAVGAPIPTTSSFCVTVNGTDVYFGGRFDIAPSGTVGSIAKWDTVGEVWSGVGAGALHSGEMVYTLHHDGSVLYAGGNFTDIGGVTGADRIAKYNGTWSVLGSGVATGTIVNKIVQYGTDLLIGGTFTGGILLWNGSSLAILGEGVNSSVKSIAVYLTDVYIAGSFTDAGNRIAKYSGGGWWKLAEGLNDAVRDIELVENGDGVDVYAIGFFTEADGKPVNNMAVYISSFDSLVDHLENGSGFDLAAAIHGAPLKSPAEANDELPMWNSFTKKLSKITLTVLWNFIKGLADLAYVTLTGNQTIAGVKTFGSSPVVPTPTTDMQAATKKYVDDNSGGGGGGTPGGSNGDVQYNNAGALGGSDEFVIDPSGKVLYLGETASSSGVPGQGLNFSPTASAAHVMNTWGTGLASYFKGVLARGTKASPTAVQSADVLVRYRGAGYDGVTGVGGAATNGEIRVVATENFDGTHHGANVEIHATPTGSTTLAKILSILGNGNVDIAAGKQYLVGGVGVGFGENILPNGGMRIKQRGAGPFTSATLFPNNDAVYLVDGMVLLSDGNDVVDVFVDADNDFVSGYKVCLDVETANKRFGVMFPIEKRDIQNIRYSGKASLQFKVKVTGTSIANCRAYLLSWSGTADTITLDPISAWGSAGANPTFATNWTAENTASNLAVSTVIAKYQIENIDVDTSGVNNLAVLIMVDDTDATVGDYFEIGDVKLEAGEVCTKYANRAYEDDLQICRRQFEAVMLGSGQSIAAGFADSTANGLVFYNYKNTKRIAAHTFSYSALSDFTIRYSGFSVSTVTAFTFGSNGVEGATLVAVATGTPLTIGQGVNLRAANANAVLYFSSELRA